jgi:hypothetical protein
MSEQTNAAVHIGQLNLRIPGDGAKTGYRVANGIAQGLSQKVPTGMQHQIGALSVRVHVPAGASEAQISDAISEAIVRALGKGSRETNASS